MALQGHASYTELSRNFILLSVVFRAIVLVLASIFKFDDWNSTTLDKYGCLPWNIQAVFEKFKTAFFINANEFSFPYKRHKESCESI